MNLYVFLYIIIKKVRDFWKVRDSGLPGHHNLARAKPNSSPNEKHSRRRAQLPIKHRMDSTTHIKGRLYLSNSASQLVCSDEGVLRVCDRALLFTISPAKTLVITWEKDAHLLTRYQETNQVDQECWSHLRVSEISPGIQHTLVISNETVITLVWFPEPQTLPSTFCQHIDQTNKHEESHAALVKLFHRFAMYYDESSKISSNSEEERKKAFLFYLMSASFGDARAQYNLSLCYEEGFGVTQDSKRAFQWNKKSALQGNDRAQYNLAVCYEEGEIVKKDIRKSVYWYELSAKQNNIKAQYNLARYCEQKSQ